MDFFKMENEPLVDELVKLKAQKDALERKEKAIRNMLMDAMREHHIEAFDTDSARIVYVEDTDVKRIDSEKLKSRYPSAYHNCCTYGFRDSYLLVRVKNNGSRKAI